MGLLAMLQDDGSIPQPLSCKLRRAREQFSGMFNGGELDLLPQETRFILRGLELFLLEAEKDAFELENNVRVQRRKETK